MTCDMRNCDNPAAIFTWEEQFCDECWVEVETPVQQVVEPHGEED